MYVIFEVFCIINFSLRHIAFKFLSDLQLKDKNDFLECGDHNLKNGIMLIFGKMNLIFRHYLDKSIALCVRIFILLKQD
jgi:hypothetical protein